MKRCIWAGDALCLLAVLAGAAALGQEPADTDQKAKTERQKSLREMQELIGTLKVSLVSDTEKSAVKLSAKALMHYQDQPRKIFDATLWRFGENGRPAALCKIEKIGFGDRHRWLYCFASLSASPVDAAWGDGKTLSTKSAGVRFLDLPGSPVPAATSEGRLRQAKDLARRISISLADPDLMFNENLRLLTHPIHRYDDPPAGILDAVLFAFSTNGTCPDLIVMVEAQTMKGSDAKWTIAAARMTNCELRLRDQDREIWSAPFLNFADHVGKQLDTWMFFWSDSP